MADVATEHFGHIDRDYMQHLASVPADDDGPIWITSLMRLHDAELGASHLQQIVQAVGGQVVLAGEVVADHSDHRQGWSDVSIVKYPSRHSFVRLTEDPAFTEEQTFQRMHLQRALIIGCIPSPEVRAHADDRPVWNAVPHPATDEDSPIVALTVVRYRGADSEPDDLAAHAQALIHASVPHGARLSRSFAVEGMVISHGQTWDHVRLTSYPSQAAFEAVMQDLSRIDAFRRHRANLVAETTALAIRPTIDTVGRSLHDG